MDNEEITTHLNENGVRYYSKKDENGDTIYSFTTCFEDFWIKDDEELYGAK